MPTFLEAFNVWVRIALNSFGGPAGQIAVMHRILVDEKKWVDEPRFLHALNYCMLLPGPEAQQLATYIGWLLHGVKGGLVAGGLFVLPGFLSILALSLLYVNFQDVPAVLGLLYGLKAAVLAVVLEAVVRIGKRVLKNRTMVGVATAAFLAIFAFGVPFPVVVGCAGLVGFIGARLSPATWGVLQLHAGAGSLRQEKGSFVRTVLTWLVLWWAPVLGVGVVFGWESVFVKIGLFFSQAAMVTFGGAYALLAWIAQRAVEDYGWLTTGEMMDGLGMAETTPGPLIQVVQFVGFLGAYREPGSLSPLTAGVLASILTTWVTFMPSFLWIFAGAPYIENLRSYPRLTAALSAITACVVGVVLNLAVWFGVHVVFPGRFDPLATGIALVSAVALLRFHVPLGFVLGGAVGIGMLASIGA